MYKNFCDFNGFDLIKVEHETIVCAAGKLGCKSGKFDISGDNVYNFFKYEAGVHKVQRVPLTENKGRVHSSTCQVAILKSNNNDFVTKELNERDLKYEFMRAGGPGGQHVNKTDSACRVTHLPTGISCHISEFREQWKNKSQAVKLLTDRINNESYTKFTDNIKQDRKSQTGSGNLSEKIRTYNYPDQRVTDHRIGITKYGMEKMMLQNLLNEFVELSQQNDRNTLINKLLNV
jgi:peptide chain release factor 1